MSALSEAAESRGLHRSAGSSLPELERLPTPLFTQVLQFLSLQEKLLQLTHLRSSFLLDPLAFSYDRLALSAASLSALSSSSSPPRLLTHLGTFFLHDDAGDEKPLLYNSHQPSALLLSLLSLRQPALAAFPHLRRLLLTNISSKGLSMTTFLTTLLCCPSLSSASSSSSSTTVSSPLVLCPAFPRHPPPVDPLPLWGRCRALGRPLT